MSLAEDPGQIARREGALIDYLEPLLEKRRSTLDHAQIAALDRLQQLADELAQFRAATHRRSSASSRCRTFRAACTCGAAWVAARAS
jgi:hypothetical protein